jgi:hypothetical protein
MLITAVKPEITREQAVAKFRGGFSQLRHGRLRIAADFYIPYRLFQITWDHGRRATNTILAADAVTGKFDLIKFNQLPEEGDRMSVDTVLFAEERVNEEDAFKLVRERMMRLLFMKGFFKLPRVNLEIHLAASLHLPYWVGVYDRQGRAHLEIINALQGGFEGAKLREIVAEWFQ